VKAADRGTATAEMAVSLPTLVLLLLIGVSALMVVRDQIACVDLAREAARAAARGDPVPNPRTGTVTVTTDGDLVRATVHLRRTPLGGGLPGFDITATAVAAVEPS
jgi:hypothetical protein